MQATIALAGPRLANGAHRIAWGGGDVSLMNAASSPRDRNAATPSPIQDSHAGSHTKDASSGHTSPEQDLTLTLAIDKAGTGTGRSGSPVGQGTIGGSLLHVDKSPRVNGTILSKPDERSPRRTFTNSQADTNTSQQDSEVYSPEAMQGLQHSGHGNAGTGIGFGMGMPSTAYSGSASGLGIGLGPFDLHHHHHAHTGALALRVNDEDSKATSECDPNSGGRTPHGLQSVSSFDRAHSVTVKRSQLLQSPMVGADRLSATNGVNGTAGHAAAAPSIHLHRSRAQEEAVILDSLREHKSALSARGGAAGGDASTGLHSDHPQEVMLDHDMDLQSAISIVPRVGSQNTFDPSIEYPRLSPTAGHRMRALLGSLEGPYELWQANNERAEVRLEISHNWVQRACALPLLCLWPFLNWRTHVYQVLRTGACTFSEVPALPFARPKVSFWKIASAHVNCWMPSLYGEVRFVDAVTNREHIVSLESVNEPECQRDVSFGCCGLGDSDARFRVWHADAMAIVKAVNLHIGNLEAYRYPFKCSHCHTRTDCVMGMWQHQRMTHEECAKWHDTDPWIYDETAASVFASHSDHEHKPQRAATTTSSSSTKLPTRQLRAASVITSSAPTSAASRDTPPANKARVGRTQSAIL